MLDGTVFYSFEEAQASSCENEPDSIFIVRLDVIVTTAYDTN